MKKVKIMLVLRDPIDRDLSAYNHKVFDYKAIIENDPNFDAEGTFYQDTVHAGGAIKNFTEFGECSVIQTLILMRLTVCGLTNVFCGNPKRNSQHGTIKNIGLGRKFIGKKMPGTLQK